MILMVCSQPLEDEAFGRNYSRMAGGAEDDP